MRLRDGNTISWPGKASPKAGLTPLTRLVAGIYISTCGWFHVEKTDYGWTWFLGDEGHMGYYKTKNEAHKALDAYRGIEDYR